MRRLIVMMLFIAAAAQAGDDDDEFKPEPQPAPHEHAWKSKTTSKKCCLSGEKEPNCTGTQTKTYLVCACGAERGQDSKACQ